MRWTSESATKLNWSTEIVNRQAKKRVAEELASRIKDGDVVGVGSGSTCFLALQAIGQRSRNEGLQILAIPTSVEVEIACSILGIQTVSLLHVRPDWAFDGADEVDPNGNLIKGRGGALFREKLVLSSAPQATIIVDASKLVSELGQVFPVPVETYPVALHYVEEELARLGATDVRLRLAKTKDGPTITEAGNYLLDCRFPKIETSLEKTIKKIPGVIESGLFCGYPLEILVASQEITE